MAVFFQIARTVALLAVAGVVSAFPAETTVYQKLLVVGDSITHHSPSASLGWEGDWGMAASSKDRDYVHLFLARLTARQGNPPSILIMAEGGGTLAAQVAQKDKMTAFGADLAIVQMGENDHDASEASFEKPYEEILDAIRRGNPSVTLLCLGVWSPPNGTVDKDEFVQAACRHAGALFVGLNGIDTDPLASAGTEHCFTNPGVNWHPGDEGMQKYADALWAALTDPASADRDSPRTAPSTAQIVDEEWTGTSGLAWSRSPLVETEDEHAVAKMINSTPGGSEMMTASLPVDALKGRWVTIEARVKGEGISIHPQPWNGPKLMLHFRNAEGKDDYPQAPLPDGSFDWKDIRWRLRVPDNVIDVQLSLGLEAVRGTVWFGALRISVE